MTSLLARSSLSNDVSLFSAACGRHVKWSRVALAAARVCRGDLKESDNAWTRFSGAAVRVTDGSTVKSALNMSSDEEFQFKS